MEKLKGIQEVLLLQIFLLVCTILLQENRVDFPQYQSCKQELVPVNCGCSLSHPGWKSSLSQAGARTLKSSWAEQRWGNTRCSPITICLPPFPCGPLSLFSFPSSSSPSLWTCQGLIPIEQTLLGFRGMWHQGFVHCHVHRQHKISCLYGSDEAQALGMIVAIYRALWWCNQQKRVATSAMLESNKSIPAFPVSQFICKDARLYFKA